MILQTLSTTHFFIPLVPNSGSPHTIRVQRSTVDSLCTLTRLTSSTSESIDSFLPITKDSNNADFNIVPVSRSYDNYWWEEVAGPYAEVLEIKNCDSSACDIVIPILENLAPGKFVLMTVVHSLNSKEKISRFLGQATFGPTMNAINEFGSPTASNFEQWVHSQIDIEPTYHREFFRENTHYSLNEEKIDYTVKPRNPCFKNSQWRQYAFTADDYAKNLTVSELNDGTFLLSVEGVPRTVLNTWKDDEENNLGTGEFEFCWWTEEVVGGAFAVNPGTNINDCIYVLNGNPKLNLPNSILDDENYSNDLKIISLPDRSNFEDMVPLLVPDREHFRFGGGLRLTTNFTNSVCDQLPLGVYQNLIGIISGENATQVMYSGFIDLQTNTNEDPIGVSGGTSFETSTLCPNVQKSFLNRKWVL